MAKRTPEERRKKNRQFVGGLGWFFLIFFLYSFANSVAQLIIFSETPPMEYLKRHFSGSDFLLVLETMPLFLVSALSEYFMELTWVSVISSALLVYPAYALIKRRPWSRMFWAVFMLLTIVVGIVPFFFTQHFIPRIPTGGAPELAAAFERTVLLALVVFAVVVAAFHGWIAYRLMSKGVKEEFEIKDDSEKPSETAPQ